MKALFAIVLALTAALPVSAQQTMPPAPFAYRQLDDPAAEQQAQDLMVTIRCLTCQSQSIADSDAPLAGDMRDQVRRRIAAGESPASIRALMQARYGDYISYKPMWAATTWPLFVLPGVFLIAAFVIGWRRIGKRAARTDA